MRELKNNDLRLVKSNLNKSKKCHYKQYKVYEDNGDYKMVSTKTGQFMRYGKDYKFIDKGVMPKEGIPGGKIEENLVSEEGKDDEGSSSEDDVVPGKDEEKSIIPDEVLQRVSARITKWYDLYGSKNAGICSVCNKTQIFAYDCEFVQDVKNNKITACCSACFTRLNLVSQLLTKPITVEKVVQPVVEKVVQPVVEKVVQPVVEKVVQPAPDMKKIEDMINALSQKLDTNTKALEIKIDYMYQSILQLYDKLLQIQNTKQLSPPMATQQSKSSRDLSF
jgi:hypothetical protein